ncbi:homoserine dehydrogenase [Neobacillus niacini]|uniref:homoserine dehydrogenase n=1 Tax=Neobacillus niacini TaxID=86668 RepID=UPI00398393DC
MTRIRVALLGLGTVGYGTYSALTNREERLSSLTGKSFETIGILIKNKEKPRSIDENVMVTTSFDEIIEKGNPDVVIEAMGGIEPALSYIKQALQNGCHVISANKELIASHGKEIMEIAHASGVRFIYEASVGGGIPVLRTIKELLGGNQIERVEAILNGTTNFILSHMRTTGDSFPKSLELAQQKGYAEPDPTNDIEGLDAFYKAMVLSEWIFGEQPDWEQVNVQGIKGISHEEILLADQLGLRLKHLVLIDSQLNVEVKPVFVDKDHPLHGVENVDNALRIKTDLLGYLTLQGPGAGAEATASAVIEDLLSIYLTKENKNYQYSRITKNTYENEALTQKVYLLFYQSTNLQKEITSQLHAHGDIIKTNQSSILNKSYILFKGDLTHYEHPLLINKYEVKIYNSSTSTLLNLPEKVN